ncbi:unnamed protein product [Staurois parvus]|uniref:Uncharacterized protein n=1 Tax=Staurois parvus TaxID=386267 RepID=A0ABN9B054_9NEOB|nr:unnamed protein product [Staurois parvus]
MISYGTCSHLCIFTRCVIWKGSGTFLNAKSCCFASRDGKHCRKSMFCVFAAF